MDDDYHTGTHQRRETDNSAAARLTGLSGSQLVTQVVGGLLLAAVVGLLSGWATQQVMTQQLTTLSRQVDEVRADLQRMRQDLYAPRYRSSRIVGATHASPLRLPPGRP